ncbi:hypothetical protein [Paraburkholderia sp. EG304]|uniref:hypothetical protein n=1 Tax=Paraburkholderia sp. EG304 TaxID=3237015 RepID=UPI0039789F60
MKIIAAGSSARGARAVSAAKENWRLRVTARRGPAKLEDESCEWKPSVAREGEAGVTAPGGENRMNGEDERRARVGVA